MKRSTQIFILLIFSKIILAQNGWNAFLGGASGTFLSGPETSLAIDKFGNKWIGFTSSLANSPAAVARYDKTTGFWSYYNATNTPAIPNNRVNAIACDTSGNVYIGTNAGLVKFDGSGWNCYTTANGLPSNTILSIECVFNHVYIGTYSGLTRLTNGTFFNYNTSNGLLSNDTITCIRSQSPTQLWLGNYNRIIEFNINSNFTFSSYNVHSIPFTTNKINCIYVDNIGKKWLGTASKGLVEYDNLNFSLATNTYSEMIGAFTPSTNCLDIAKGPSGGPIVLTNCAAYTTPSGNSTSCLLELLPNKDYKVYYVSDNNYTIGDFIETDPNGEIFVGNRNLVHMGNFLKFMFSFKPWLYNPHMQGPGFGVNNKNFKFLDINRVRAGIANRGDMFWDLGGTANARYEVPKGSGSHSAFCKALWIGGLDASNQLHIASQTYRQNGSDFWPGPLDTINALIDSTTLVNYDKIWKISYNDINDFITNFQNGNIANNTYTPTIDIITWPAKGSGNYSRNLAPFVDVNNNGIYDPLTGGDYPRIKGDQTLYFIFNDAYGAHSETWGAKLGVEVHCMAYAYGCPNFINGRNELAYTTFYNYRIINRSNNNYHHMKIGLLDEGDLGNYTDDRIGCDVGNNIGFMYNGDGVDENVSGANGYGNYPPAIGGKILKGPPAPQNDGYDNNNNGIIDELNEECLMNQFAYYNNNIGSFNTTTHPPRSPYQYFNYIDGRWRDSSNFTCGNYGFGGTVPTKFIYPWVSYSGNPCALWADNQAPAGDRRHISSAGPFNLSAKQQVEFEFAQIWAVDSSSTGNVLGSINKLISNAQLINAFYQSGVQSTCLPNMAIGMNEITPAIKASLYPNPAQQQLTIDISETETTSIVITNLLGQTVFSKTYYGERQLKADISYLNAGIYIVNLQQAQGRLSLKFIKQ